MKKIAFLAVIALFGMVATGFAQSNSATDLLDSPYKVEAEVSAAGESLYCTTLILGGTGALFSTDDIPGTSPVVFIQDELFSPFRVNTYDEFCNTITTWTAGYAGFTMTGIAVDVVTPTVYWAVDPTSAANIQNYAMGTGAPLGTTCPLPAVPGALFGPLAMDLHAGAGARIVIVEDIVTDMYFEIDLSTCAIGASFPNPDNAGSGAYGNGADGAVNISGSCSAHWSVTSGTITEGMVRRATQMDASVTCYGTWDFYPAIGPSGEFFANGYAEFQSTGGSAEIKAAVIGNVTSLLFILDKPQGIANCQGIDAPVSDVLYTNGKQGGDGPYNVNVGVVAPHAHSIQAIPGSPNKFLVHLNQGVPTANTLTALPAGLGTFCFPLMIPPYGSASPACVWNNIGKTNKVGGSNHFGTPIPNPAKAPTFYQLHTTGDPANQPVGWVGTFQGIILNPGASSPKGASVTNAYTMTVTP